MFDKILNVIKKLSFILALSFLGLWVILGIVIQALGFQQAQAGEIFYGIINITVILILAGGLAVALILKNEVATKVMAILFVAAAAYGFFSSLAWAFQYYDYLAGFAVVEMLLYAVLVTMVVFEILPYFIGKLMILRKINIILALAALALGLIAFIVEVIISAQNNAGAVSYVNIINSFLVFIPLILVLYLGFIYKAE